MFQGMMENYKWPGQEWKTNVAEVDSMMFSMDVELKNKHTSIKRRRISKTITSGRYRVILPMFNERKILKQEIYIFFKRDEQERQC